MKVYDLTHIMTDGMPVFPGSESAVVKSVASFETNGYNEKRLEINSHTGTHIDCRKHIFPDGFHTGAEPVHFTGNGIMIDCATFQDVIPAAHFALYHDRISNADFVLIYTGNSQYWGNERYFIDFPVLSEEAADYLNHFNLKGVGIDAPSFDPVHSKELPVHHIFLASGKILIENLTNLQLLEGLAFMFFCLPLKIEEGDGSPVRAIAVTNIKS